MNVGIAAVLFLTVSLVSAAPERKPARHSQQFSVVDVRSELAVPAARLRSASGEDLLRLDVDVLLLSANRVKEALWNELDLNERGGRIDAVLYRATRVEDPVGIIGAHTPKGWEYRLEVPDQIDSDKLVRGLVQVLMLEVANRGQGPKSAELPMWLVEGMTAHLMAVAGPELVIGSVPVGSMLRIVRERQGLDYLRGARAVLRGTVPLTFSELAYPRPETVFRERVKVFQASAHLFVYELLQTPNGPKKLTAMLRQLPVCWNWEMALLRSFPSEFGRMLDVEKKWSVDVLAFSSQYPELVRSKAHFLEQLDGILQVPARVSVGPEALPERRTVPLREVIMNWDFASQAAVLRQKLFQLQRLRFASPPEIVPLIDSYYRTLATYLQKRGTAGREPENRMQPTLNASLVAQEALKSLALLDKQREALDPVRSASVKPTINH